MAIINFGYRVNMDDIAPPIDENGFVVAYDTKDGILKQKDHHSIVSVLGGGSIGPQGPAGPVGPAGLTWSGSWVATASYSNNYVVGYASASYWCVNPITGSTSNIGPDIDRDHWSLLAAQGSPGPAGAQGSRGSDGSRGPVGINWNGDWIPGVYIINDGVYYNGSSYRCVVATNDAPNDVPDSFIGITYWKPIALKGDNGSQDAYRFTSGLTVSLRDDKTFGRYRNGDTIPATNLTVYQLLQMAISESIPPTINLISSSNIAFGQTAINNALSYGYEIKTPGAVVSSTVLDFRRNNSGIWTTLSTSTQSTSFTHSLNDLAFATQSFNYRYTVTDSQGATASIIKNISPAIYSAPSVTLSLSGNVYSPETNLMRELGNYSSTLSGNILRTSQNIDLQSYELQYKKNNGSWNTFTSSLVSGNNVQFSNILHSDSDLGDSTSISYKVLVTDSYTQSESSLETINFYKLIFYGAVDSVPGTSSEVRALPDRIFASGPSSSTSFILSNGTQLNNWSVALPDTLQIDDIIDVKSNFHITTYYTDNLVNFDVGNYGATSSYKVYTMTSAIPYTKDGNTHLIKIK